MTNTRILVEGLEVSCLIGVHGREQLTPQPILVDIEAFLDASAAALADDLDQTRNYDNLATELGFILQTCRFHLLESAAHVLLRWLLLPPVEGSPVAPIQRARVRLSKPQALPGRALAVVECSGDAENQAWEHEEKSWGRVDIVAETRRTGIYRLTLQPDCELPTHHHQVMRESELVLEPGLLGWKDGQPPTPLTVGTVLEWRKEQRHGYQNSSDTPASLLCVDSPPFDPKDEILEEAS
ncbi:MAG: dihydroneopterin aldolase [Myxococcota bacterium]|nr:dihydroneopterin aldolase [Myxococcota bacterium]